MTLGTLSRFPVDRGRRALPEASPKLSASAGLAFDREPPAMAGDDVLDDRKAKPGAALLPAFDNVGAVKRSVRRGRCSGAMPGP